jgi:hypothetical protein
VADVFKNVFGIFETYRHANEPIRNSMFCAFLGGIGQMRHAGGVLNRGLRVAKAHRALSQIERVDEGAALLEPPLKFERGRGRFRPTFAA